MNDDQLIAEQIVLLPEKLQDFLVAPETGEAISTIAEKYKVDERVTNAISGELIGVALGITDTSQLTQKIERSANISHDVALQIFGDIEKDVLAPVQGELKKTREEFLKSEKNIPRPIEPEDGAPAVAIIPNNQPYTGGGQKSSIPVKDVNPFLPPLTKNDANSVPRIVVPPNVNVSEAFKGPAPAPLAPELQTPFAPTGEVVARAPEKTTPITSALAAELGGLMDQKPNPAPPIAPIQNKPPAPVSIPVLATQKPAAKIEPPVNLPIASAPSFPKPQINQPPKVNPQPGRPAAPVAPQAPINKLNTMTQKPRVEVEMVKTAPGEAKKGDPYREPVE